MSTPYLDAIEAILIAGRIISKVEDKKELKLLKTCIEQVFQSSFKNIADTEPAKKAVKPISKANRLVEEQYMILKTMVDNGDLYTGLDSLVKAIYKNQLTTYVDILPVLRRFLKNNGNCEIEIEQSRSRTADDQYRIKKASVPKVMRLISDSYYSGYPGYKDYTSFLQSASSKPSVSVHPVSLAKRSHAQLERDIIDAIPYARNINHVCNMVGRKTSGPMYKLVKDILARYNLRIGSKLDFDLSFTNGYQTA